MKEYLKIHFWDVILCVCISTGLSVNVFAGFNMTDPLAGNLPAVIGIAAVITAAFVLAYFYKITLPIAGMLTIAAFIGAGVALWRTGAFASAGAIDKSPLLFWVIVISASAFTFWATRSRIGIVILFLIGTWITATFKLLIYPVSGTGYLGFVFCCFVMFMYRVCCTSAKRSDVGKIRPNALFIQSLLLSAAVLLCGIGGYYGVIKPLAPPTDQTQIAAKMMSMEFFEKAGISYTKIVHTDQLPSDAKNTIETPQQETQNITQPANTNTAKSQKDTKKEKMSTLRNLANKIAVTFKKNAHYILIAVVSVVLLFLLAVVMKRFLRKKWYSDLLKKTKEDRAMALYTFFLEKMCKAGFQKADALTLLEYAVNSEETMQEFAVYDASFLSLTKIYLRILYGYSTISEKEWDLFHDFYKEFYRNIRKEMGSFRYYLHFFSI